MPQNEETTFLIGFDLNTDVRVVSEKKKCCMPVITVHTTIFTPSHTHQGGTQINVFTNMVSMAIRFKKKEKKKQKQKVCGSLNAYIRDRLLMKTKPLGFPRSLSAPRFL